MRLVLIPLLALALLPLPAFAQRENAWKEVEEAASQALPQTALERLQPILEAALRDQAWGEAARALARRAALETAIQGGHPHEYVRRLSTAIPTTPEPLRPILHALVGHGYWTYFNQNRWRFHQRSTTATPPGDDFETWDLPRLFAEIDRHFTAALASPERLRSVPVAAFDAVLTRGTMPDRYRPTLYDFLVHEALQFLTAAEQPLPLPENAFVLRADSPVLDTAESFLAWNPAPGDNPAPILKAVRLLQDLMRAHRSNPDRSAWHDADLARIRLGGNEAVGPDRDARYLAALSRFAGEAGADPLSALARHTAASVLRGQERLREAHDLAREGASRFPESPGGRLCAEMVRSIEAPSVQLTTERSWSGSRPEVEVRHRNAPRLWLRVVTGNWDSHLDRRRGRPESPNNEDRRALLAAPVRHAWAVDLPPTPDYKDRTDRVTVPVDLEPGFYFVLASRRADFAAEDNEVLFTSLWVSDLALVVRTRAGWLEGLVVRAESGEPVSGAQVQAWGLARDGRRVALQPRTTGDDGAFAFQHPGEARPHLVKASRGGHAIATADDLWWHGGEPEPQGVIERTVFFTDRGLYRPGQLIQYKGLCLLSAPEQARYEVLAGRAVVVVLRDANGRELARNQHRANEFGSFSGSFTAPADALSGFLQLAVDGAPAGFGSVRVEEYKRPRFQVILESPDTPPRLGESATVRGRGVSYVGAPVDGAKVAWRVERMVRFPWPMPWRLPEPGGGPAQALAHGESRTGSDGSFEVTFPCQPDLSIPESREPVFHFTVHAEITDSAGETRSQSRTFAVGYNALTADLDAPAFLTSAEPVELRLGLRTVGGDAAPGSGILRIHRLRQPDRTARMPIAGIVPRPPGLPEEQPGALDPQGPDPDAWPGAGVLSETQIAVPASGTFTNRVPLPAGAYRAEFTLRDVSGREVTARRTLLVLDPAARQLPARVPYLLAARSWEVEPGSDFVALWGTGYESGRARIEIERQHRIVQRFWTEPGRTQQEIRVPVPENWRGGFTVHVTFVQANRARTDSLRVEVPWSSKHLDIAWETFRSRVDPGTPETWTAIVRSVGGRKDAERLAAEWVATLYDASLDAFEPFEWPGRLDVFSSDHSTAMSVFANGVAGFSLLLGQAPRAIPAEPAEYRAFRPELLPVTSRRVYALTGTLTGTRSVMPLAAMDSGGLQAAPPAKLMAPAAEAAFAAGAGEPPAGSQAPSTPPPIRRNLQETAFFLPHAVSDTNGVVRLSFTMPEALTEWRFLGFAHDRQLRSGKLEGKTVTSRDLMVLPNPPRFLREGDTLEFTARVINTSKEGQSGTVTLHLTAAGDDRALDRDFGNEQPRLAFEVPAGESRGYSWRLQVPEGAPLLRYRVTATAGRTTDGEEGLLPVLSRRVFLTESMTLPIVGPGERRFRFDALAGAAASPSLRHHALTVQATSRPAWYAVLALPYLMEFPHACAEQVFNRHYANALARHIAMGDPRIRAVFDQWRNTPALESPLARNPELRAIALEETPWLRDARDEREARRNLGVLFEQARLESELARALDELSKMQSPEGWWPWFPGGPADHTITLYITAGFGRLRHLGAATSVEPALRALPALDTAMHERWDKLREEKRLEGNHLDPWIAFYLYARSFFLADRAVEAAHQPAFDYWVDQARRHWVSLDHRLPQGHVALALQRLRGAPPEVAAVPPAIVRSLRERSVRSDELGMFWREDERSSSWFRAPIETHALMIEIFDAVADDGASVEALKTWLLKQKQTQHWRSTKATADAVHALLLRGRNLLAGTELLELALGGTVVTPGRADPAATPPEAGTGFYERRFSGAELRPAMADITLRKSDAGVAWASMHWQYFEDLDRVRAQASGPLSLNKSLWAVRTTEKGRELTPVRGPVPVGTEVRVRVELRADRDFEYVHLKDGRASGTEPLNVLSGYRQQDGLGYYESTRDTASHFFISYLPKGTYVFEYPVRVQHRGEYPAGIAEVQCLYAPEFNSHSAAPVLTAR